LQAGTKKQDYIRPGSLPNEYLGSTFQEAIMR